MASKTSQDQEGGGWIDRIDEMDTSDLAAKVEDRLSAWEGRIEELEDEAKHTSEQVSGELGARLGVIKGTMDQVEDRLEALETAGQEHAGEIKGSIKALVIGLRRDLDEMAERLDQR